MEDSIKGVQITNAEFAEVYLHWELLGAANRNFCKLTYNLVHKLVVLLGEAHEQSGTEKYNL